VGDEGTTLAQYLGANQRMPLADGLRVLDELLALVGERHRAGATDGALTLERVLVTPEGRVRLLAADEAAPAADADAYRSPQQRDGADADVRADVYALGVMAYRLLCGAMPYAGEAADPADPRAFLPALTDRVRLSMTIAVQRNLTERFGDALTFRAALRGDSDLALASPTLRWAVAEGIPEGDTGAADEFAESDPTLEDTGPDEGPSGDWSG
jgi:serine/threonine-protein kinase